MYTYTRRIFVEESTSQMVAIQQTGTGFNKKNWLSKNLDYYKHACRCKRCGVDRQTLFLPNTNHYNATTRLTA